MLHRELVGDEPGAGWTLDQHLLAVIFDALAAANWQRAAKKGAKRPDPVSPLAKPRRADARRVGDAAGRSPEEVIALLNAHRAAGG